MPKYYIVTTTLKLAIMADSEASALEVAKEQLKELNDTLADHLVYEWSDPAIAGAEAQE